MKSSSEITDLLQCLDSSPTAWHLVEYIAQKLQKQGFEKLEEDEPWKIKPGKGYFTIRNGSTLCAFITPKKHVTDVKVAASHTDSPAFKVKPNAEFRKENMIMIGVEMYGAPMLASWLNRDLGIAGRVISKNKRGNIQETLVKCSQTPLVIPQIAIHLDRNVNESGPVLNKQEHLAAIAALAPDEKKSKASYLETILKKEMEFSELLSTDLFLYPLEPARLMGMQQEMIASYRIDNLCNAHAAAWGLLHSSAPHPTQLKMAIFWDHEEIGSNTAQGAGSPFFLHLLERITIGLQVSREDFLRLLPKSLCLSIDVAHAVHPGYSDKHEPRHPALMNKGIVIKQNAQQKYASDARSSALIIDLCRKHKIPFQKYVSRGDQPCGSTVGPIHANATGMPTIDIGTAQLSMHSCRELASCQDHEWMCKLVTNFFADK